MTGCAAVALCADPPAETKQGTAATKQSSSKAAPKTTSSKGRTSKSSKKPAPTVYRRSTQQHPTPERYMEIQRALADRGYFKGPVDGNWGADSVDALQRFQHDQNLTEDGKIGSLSLIALGLGPKRVVRSEPPQPPPPPEAR